MKKLLRSPLSILRAVAGVLVCAWVIMGSFPTGWIYDLWAGTGTGEGQTPDGQVYVLTNQEELQDLSIQSTPVTASASHFVDCPLLRLRDPNMAGTHRSRRRTVTISEYSAWSYPVTAVQRLLRSFFGEGQYNSYHLMELEDGSYVCVYFDDYLLWRLPFQGTISLPAGYVRTTTSQERSMLNKMAADYDVDPVYIVDMYRDSKASWMVDILLRIVLAAVILFVYFSMENLVKKKLAQRREREEL